MVNDDVLLFIILLVSLVLLFFFIQKLMYRGAEKNVQKKIEKRKREAVNKCPVCGTSLLPTELIISRVYHTDNKTEQKCTIVGCPYCYPYLSDGIVRRCPVCNKTIPLDGYLIAHLFTRTNKKNHVHVVGCTECHKKHFF